VILLAFPGSRKVAAGQSEIGAMASAMSGHISHAGGLFTASPSRRSIMRALRK
jgi:hypothetical protein